MSRGVEKWPSLNPKKIRYCERCSDKLDFTGSWTGRRFCSECNSLIRAENGIHKKQLHLVSKKDLRLNHKNYPAYRAAIQRHARETYKKSGRIEACEVCGYDNHYEVCHIKDVKDFDESALIGEINSLDNLLALCPNHHWEFDNDAG